jgi:small subunit ribosomal protein S2
MLTNWNTIQNSIRRLQELEEKLHDEQAGLTKKEMLNMQRQMDKLQMSLGGIRTMHSVPSLIIVIDVVHEDLAVKEAAKLRVPVIGVVDTNANIEGINYPIPGNDDATKAIKLYCDLLSQAIRQGMKDGGLALPEEQQPRAGRVSEKAKKQSEFEGAMDEGDVKKTSKKEAMSEVARLATSDKRQAI